MPLPTITYPRKTTFPYLTLPNTYSSLLLVLPYPTPSKHIPNLPHPTLSFIQYSTLMLLPYTTLHYPTDIWSTRPMAETTQGQNESPNKAQLIYPKLGRNDPGLEQSIVCLKGFFHSIGNNWLAGSWGKIKIYWKQEVKWWD